MGYFGVTAYPKAKVQQQKPADSVQVCRDSEILSFAPQTRAVV